MKARDIRDMTAEDIDKELLNLRREQFNLRMQKASGQLGQVHLLGETKRDIARVKTVMQEKQNG